MRVVSQIAGLATCRTGRRSYAGRAWRATMLASMCRETSPLSGSTSSACGRSANYAGCKAVVGSTTRQCHTEACRRRFEGILPDHDRAKGARERIDPYIAKNISRRRRASRSRRGWHQHPRVLGQRTHRRGWCPGKLQGRCVGRVVERCEEGGDGSRAVECWAIQVADVRRAKPWDGCRGSG